MRRLQSVTTVILALSLLVNGWLGIQLYKNTKILNMQTAEYNSFKLSLKEAMKATDAASNDPLRSVVQRNDMYTANMSIERAMGLIMGLRIDLAKKGLDIYPIFVALGESESPVPYLATDSQDKIQKDMQQNSRTLHELYSDLSTTSFSNAGLSKLRAVVRNLDGKYPGYPSYSSLQ